MTLLERPRSENLENLLLKYIQRVELVVVLFSRSYKLLLIVYISVMKVAHPV